jgi:GDP-mannose 6-dehydrogenase
MADWAAPPMIVWGADGASAIPAARAIARLYTGLEAPRLAIATAGSELIKYACNVFHALKVDFANEMAALAAACGADADSVMDVFCQDHKLNIAAAYLRPGSAFGGSCLPKDTRAVVAQAQAYGLKLPLIASVIPSNEEHLTRQVARVLHHGRRPALLLGLSFKPDTDDLRESPMVELAERLLGKGVPLTIHAPDLADGAGDLIGANARFIDKHLPHLNVLLKEDLRDAIRQVDTVIIAKSITGLTDAMLAGKTVIDLTIGPPAITAEPLGHIRKAA